MNGDDLYLEIHESRACVQERWLPLLQGLWRKLRHQTYMLGTFFFSNLTAAALSADKLSSYIRQQCVIFDSEYSFCYSASTSTKKNTHFKKSKHPAICLSYSESGRLKAVTHRSKREQMNTRENATIC